MQMPKPTDQHRKLEAFVGQWRGDETLHPSPWMPEERKAIGRFSARMGVDGMFLVTDYEEERDGEVFFRGHGVYGWDAGEERYTMYWFDSMGASPRRTLGVWEGDTLTFENEGPDGRARYVYEFGGPDSYSFRILASKDGAEWSTFMEGTYRRAES